MKKKQEPDISQILKELQRSYLGKPTKKAATVDDEADTSDAEFQKQLSSMLAGFSEPPKKKTKASAPSKEKVKVLEEINEPALVQEEAPAASDAPIEQPIEELSEHLIEKAIDEAPVPKKAAQDADAPKKKQTTAASKKEKKKKIEAQPASVLVDAIDAPTEKILREESDDASAEIAPVESTADEPVIEDISADPIEEIVSGETPVEPVEEITAKETPVEQTQEPAVIEEIPVAQAEKPAVIEEIPVEQTEEPTVEEKSIEQTDKSVIERQPLEPIDDSVDEPMPEPWKAPTVRIRGVTEQGYIRITPPATKSRAEGAGNFKATNDAIVIRPPVYNQRRAEPIVIRPRNTSKTIPTPAATEVCTQQEPIKIGKEVRIDSTDARIARESENNHEG